MRKLITLIIIFFTLFNFKPIFAADFSFYYKPLFNIPDKLNMQGITYNNNNIYVGYDIGNGLGRIIKYNLNGKSIASTSNLPLGHCAELAYREINNKIYVANGGGANLTTIYELDFENNKITNAFNFEYLGTSALIGIDNTSDILVLHTIENGGDHGVITFTLINLNDNSVIKSFNVPNQGIPQGLDIKDNIIYLYTNNKITIINYNGEVIKSCAINEKGESEGLTLANLNNITHTIFGYNSPNRLYISELDVIK